MRPLDARLDITALRERLATLGGRRYWKSLDDLADTEEFHELLHREFPERASEWNDPLGRRRFMQLMGASLAFAGLTACKPSPNDTIVPYVKQPEDLVPGKPLFYATAVRVGGYALGVLAESHMGRPTKIEGNPEHPVSLGATDAFAQASVLTLYDPDRSKTVTHLGEIRPWSDFLGAMRDAAAARKTRNGSGLRLLTGTVTSPTLAAQLDELLQGLPGARWHQYEPVGRDNARAGAIMAFGADAEAQYRFDEADIIVSLDADFLGCGPGAVRHVRDFTTRRRVDAEGKSAAPGGGMNRLYVVESTPSTTGGMADHRWPLRGSEIAAFAHALAAGLGAGTGRGAVALEGGEGGGSSTLGARSARSALELPPGFPREALGAIVRDLMKSAGRGLVIAGEGQPPSVHAAAHAINHALGNAGKTVFYTDSVEARSIDQAASIRELAESMRAGHVDMLVVLGANPAFDAPADLDFAGLMEKVALRVHLGLYDDETAVLSHWHVPEAHDLESWGDARSCDGTVTILQPLIDPLYGGKTAHELLAAFSTRPSRPVREIVREHWSTRFQGAGGFERAWRKALHDGVIAGSALPAKAVSLKASWSEHAAAGDADGGRRDAGNPDTSGGGNRAISRGDLEVVFRPDAAVYDGRFANNGWLQELPRPLTRLTWDNAALVSPATAERLGLANEDLVDLTLDGRSVKAPVWILPGHANDTVTVHLGYGRTRAGRVGNGAGFNAYAIRTSGAPWVAQGLSVRRTGARMPLACAQSHNSMEGRALVRAAGLEEFRHHPEFAQHLEESPEPELSLYPPKPYEGYSWGMAVDLGSCVGCNACVVACNAENNIPVVGKEQVALGREMHWLRIDRYFEGDLDNPRTLNQPVMCMHCEDAPCELVCPVAATVHSSEGLNDMVYNRCVGTRYCSNNCPYKVRRFNFFQYSDMTTPSLKMLQNPDVTVRTRGVMEKCSYCVQRINYARNDAEREDRTIRDGEITTACAQACPAGAIVFGNINDKASRVSRLKADPRNYGLLSSLGTRPRTSYLAAIRNPNPEIASGETS